MHKRQITSEEKARLRRSHLLLVPLYIIGISVLYVLIKFDHLSETVRWSGSVIACLAMLIFTSKQLKLERDLNKSQLTMFQGTVHEKRKLGGGRSGPSSGISINASRRTKSASSYFLIIDNKKFMVPVSIYSKVNEGDFVQLDFFEHSDYCVSVTVLNKD